jgi:hypothetical protein
MRRWFVSRAKVQHIPYSCCGTYNIVDTVGSGGVQLAKARTSFTFA